MLKVERILINTLPAQFVIKKSQKIVLPGFQGVPLYDVVKFFVRQVKKSNLNERAAAVSYNFVMAIPPICLFLFSLIPNLPFVKKSIIKSQVSSFISDIVPAREYNRNLIAFVNGFLDESRIGLLSFGFLLLIFFGSNGMMGLMRSFNKGYLGFHKRSGLQTRWMAIKLTFLIMGLLFACLLLIMAQGALLKWLIANPQLRSTIMLVRWVFIVALIFYSISFIYRYAPAVQKKWELVSPGSILATSLSILATIGFSIFVNNFGQYNALYGSIGTIIVIMSLIFINSLILLIGYELNVSIHSLQLMSEERKQTKSSKR
jgi:membrane protein